MRYLVALLAILYVISPIDLIPDVLPILGWLDDLGVIALALQAWNQNQRQNRSRS